jgi:tRNA 2-thiouridine synthesizing protein A
MPAAWPPADEELDTGPLGCGELLMVLAHHFRALAPGRVVAVRSYDPGALEDLPAWCRMRRQSLLAVEPLQDGHRFYIRREAM